MTDPQGNPVDLPNMSREQALNTIFVPKAVRSKLDQKQTLVQVSRDEALLQNERVEFENQSIIGSISLKGAAIDDLTFKEYNVALDSNEKVKLLSPRNTKDGYLIESGFITTDKNIDIPNSNSVWSVSGNNKLVSASIAL